MSFSGEVVQQVQLRGAHGRVLGLTPQARRAWGRGCPQFTASQPLSPIHWGRATSLYKHPLESRRTEQLQGDPGLLEPEARPLVTQPHLSYSEVRTPLNRHMTVEIVNSHCQLPTEQFELSLAETGGVWGKGTLRSAAPTTGGHAREQVSRVQHGGLCLGTENLHYGEEARTSVLCQPESVPKTH